MALAVVLLLALLATTGLKGYRDLLATQQREATLRVKVEEASHRVERLRERIDRLRHDPVTLERLAREELGMVRPNDIVIVLPETLPEDEL